MFNLVKKRFIKFIFDKEYKYLISLDGATWLTIFIFNEPYIISINQTFEDFYDHYFSKD